MKRFAALKGLVFACLIVPAAVLAQSPSGIHHEISFPLANSQYVHVRSEFPVAAEVLELAMPAWTPGSYKVRDFAAHVERMKAFDVAGNAVDFQKVAKNRWRYPTDGLDRLVVEYDVWAGRQNVSENWVESRFAVLNGAGLFLYGKHLLDLPQTVRVRAPDDWPRAATGLSPGERSLEFLASNYDELVDSPLVIGETQEKSFNTGRWPYRLALAEQNPLWDMEKSTKDLALLVDAHQEFWGVNPLEKEYVFLVAFIGRYSGLEHDHSTLMMVKRGVMRERKDYIKWLELASHEFFHAWNVRRLRPSSLLDYDYDSENYSRELWVAEGLSSYYDHLLLFRSGLIDVADYLGLLAAEIRNYEITQGRLVRSAESASFDAWVKQYDADPNRVNSTVSYYRKGALIGLTADIAIRRASGGDHSLDDVMRALYQRHGPEGSVRPGYSREDFEQIVEEFAGPEVRRAIEPLYTSTADPNVDEALDWVGLRLVRGNGKDKDLPELGVNWDDEGERLRVQSVILGHPGATAGIIPGDEVLAIGGLRLTSTNHVRVIRRFSPGDQVEVLLSRNGQVLSVSVELGTRIPEKYSIAPKERLRGRDKQRMEAWLGRSLRFSD